MPQGITKVVKIVTKPVHMFTGTGQEVIINKVQYIPVLPVIKEPVKYNSLP